MKIERSNYEIWFTDWLDGNLKSEEVEQLKLFLLDNPDLKEEFDDFNRSAVEGIPVSDSLYRNKEQLKKSIGDISLSQFEFLCVAYLEEDISLDQQAELMELIDKDDDRKRAFELVQKTKLIPPAIKFKHKTRLLRRSLLSTVVRLSVTVLSAAASIALIILTFSTSPRNPELLLKHDAQIVVRSDSIDGHITSPKRQSAMAENLNIANSERGKKRSSVGSKENSVIPGSELMPAIKAEPETTGNNNTAVIVQKLAYNLKPEIEAGYVRNTLIATNTTIRATAVDDGRSNIGKFIAKTIREKILRDKTIQDTPLKGYEIAEAGVAGLNKLLGWQMALEKNNDEFGHLKSVYFSSKILKFNAPVKKSDPVQ